MELIRAQQVMATEQAHARARYVEEYGAGAAFIADHYCPMDQAAIPIGDTGFIHADATYDVTTATRGYVFRLEDHLDRFEASCRKFRLRNPYNRDETGTILLELVRKTGFKDCYIWWSVTRGAFPAGPEKTDPDAHENRFYAFVVPYRFIADDELRLRGIDMMVARTHFRIPTSSVDPTAKNFHWMDMKLSMFEARDNGYDWAVLTDADGYLTEAPGSNIFLLKGSELATPANGCLEGITRQTALELARELGLETRVGLVHAEELKTCDEVFTTSSAGGIMPVNSIDGRILGDKPGPGQHTTRIHNEYWTRRWQGWLGTPVTYDG